MLTSITKQFDDTADDHGTTAWANFKCVIWHKAVYKILESAEQPSKLGCWVTCGDDVVRHIFIVILILAADYEEQ